MNTYIVGGKIRLGMTLRDIDQALADPTGLTFKIRDPAGTVTTHVWNTDAELVRGSEGVFWVDWPIAVDGRHIYRWESTGAAQGAAEQAFTARPSSFA